jgi:hyperosmotically inducible periplasmic protein
MGGADAIGASLRPFPPQQGAFDESSHPTLTLPRVVLSAAVVAALAACNPTDRQEVSKDASQAGRSAAASAEKAAENTGQAIDDAGITAKVKSSLLADDQVKGLSINVDTSGGAVTLTGSAQTAAEKQRAEQLATGVEGVRSVQNNITVAQGAGSPAAPANGSGTTMKK